MTDRGMKRVTIWVRTMMRSKPSCVYPIGAENACPHDASIHAFVSERDGVYSYTGSSLCEDHEKHKSEVSA